MSLNENTTERSCSAVLKAGRILKTSSWGSLSSVTSPKRSTVYSNSQGRIRERNTSTPNEKSISTLDGVRSKNLRKSKKQKEKAVNTCHCTDCTNSDDLPKYLCELEDQLRTLEKELIQQKNESQLLKRHIMMAKKVVNMEIGVEKEESFENFLKRANADSWRGRKELIFELRNKLRDLNEILEAIGCEPPKCYSNKRPQIKNEQQEIFLEEWTVDRCMKSARQDVWKNEDRYKQNLIASKSAMKNTLELLTDRNEKLKNEIKSLREKLSEAPKIDDEKLEKQLREIQSYLKPALEEKVESRQKLNIVQQHICRNSKISAELRSRADAEKLNLIDEEAKVKSLMAEEENLQAEFEEIRNDRYKQTTSMKKKLQDIEQEYSKIAIKSEQVPNSIKNGQILIKKLKKISFYNVHKVNCDIPKDESDNASASSIEQGSGFQFSVESTSGDVIHFYKKKLLKYKTLSEKLERKVKGKLNIFYNLNLEAKEEVFKLLRNRFMLWKLATDVDVLKVREKKFKMAVLNPSKQKLFIKKNSSQQLIEVFDARKMKLAIKKIEYSHASMKDLVH